ncbi:hypothetical protein KBC99_01295 [Candidatus Saccharibacteria bacterium]|nr:hypothetical protein [Candidatus Saccharibacteria bacterium]
MSRLKVLILIALFGVISFGYFSYAQAMPRNPMSIVHRDIATTVFMAGSPAGIYDQGISNQSSAWYANWAKHMGGIDDGQTLQLVRPGLDNLYYFALPCADFDDTGLLLSNVEASPWAATKNQSAFKNRWIKIWNEQSFVYAQWEDVGPLYTDDCKTYVFGADRPRQEKTRAVASALDLSPAAFKTLNQGIADGVILTNWQFVSAISVPDGPWRQNITTSGPDWSS